MSFDLSKKSSQVRAWDGQKDVLSLASDHLLAVGLARRVKRYPTDLFALAGGKAVTTCGDVE
jgi:hypothetical protein